MTCDTCGCDMRPLFVGFFCPNDCDRRPKLSKPEAMVYTGSNHWLRGRPMYRQSQLWVPIGYKNSRRLDCPICGEPLVCGDQGEGEDCFGATCRNSDYHQIVVLNDEGR